jgi:hypothetical protein|tara:strand:+ start:200 stop:358 length:159 start_codon:yes stop_codon:yes gene_type:complete
MQNILKISNPYLMRVKAALAQEGVSLDELVLDEAAILLDYIGVIDVLLKVKD